MTARCFVLMIGLGATALLHFGCGDSPEGGNIKLAQGGGTLKLNGSPVAGAAVTFIPENGPIATGTTDLAGKFTLSTGGRSGVAIGKCTVTVTAYEGGAKPAATESRAVPTSKPANPEEFKKKMEAPAMKVQSESPQSTAAPKSIIPEVYGKQDTTTLSFTVESDASKNQFPIDLKD